MIANTPDLIAFADPVAADRPRPPRHLHMTDPPCTLCVLADAKFPVHGETLLTTPNRARTANLIFEPGGNITV